MKPSTMKVLGMLQQGPVTTGEFAAAFCPRASARIAELREMGYTIRTRQLTPSAFEYDLVGSPPDPTVPPIPPMAEPPSSASLSPEQKSTDRYVARNPEFRPYRKAIQADNAKLHRLFARHRAGEATPDKEDR